MQNKRFLQLTLAAVIISISCFLYVKFSIDKIDYDDDVEIKTEQVDESDRIGLGFSDIEIIQRIGSTFKFLQTLKP